MKRDADLIRERLFQLEGEEDYSSFKFADGKTTDPEERRRFGHIKLMADAGLVELSGTYRDGVRVTNDGYDFIAAIRDDTIWAKTKDAGTDLGGMTLGVLKDVAVAMVRAKLAATTGLNI